jgi:hypothetical protein
MHSTKTTFLQDIGMPFEHYQQELFLLCKGDITARQTALVSCKSGFLHILTRLLPGAVSSRATLVAASRVAGSSSSDSAELKTVSTEAAKLERKDCTE